MAWWSGALNWVSGRMSIELGTMSPAVSDNAGKLTRLRLLFRDFPYLVNTDNA